MTYTERAELLNATKTLINYCKKADCENCYVNTNLCFCLDVGIEYGVEKGIIKESERMVKELSNILLKISDDYEIIPKWEVEEMKNKIKALEENDDKDLGSLEFSFVSDKKNGGLLHNED